VIRAVIDTNVLVSGLLAPNGNESLVLLAVRQGLIMPCFSEEIYSEYRGVLARRKFSFPPQILALLSMILRCGEPVRPEKSLVSSPDPGDTKFLDCAFASQADFLVTGNKRHFPGSPYGRTHVIERRGVARPDRIRDMSNAP
jgi:putative PIN family toxin of toxin-antitoxin system